MSKIKDLAYDIEQLYIDGLSPREIATQLACPVSFVYDWLTETGVAETQQEEFSPYNGA